jgi:hypothetical protein
MYSPDISQRLHQISERIGLPITEVADQLIGHGLKHLEAIFDWKPEMGKAGFELPATDEKSA